MKITSRRARGAKSPGGRIHNGYRVTIDGVSQFVVLYWPTGDWRFDHRTARALALIRHQRGTAADYRGFTETETRALDRGLYARR